MTWKIVALAYYVGIVVCHDWMTKVYVQMFNYFGRSRMESSMHLGSLLLLFFVVGLCVFMIRLRHRLSIRTVSVWTATALFMVLADVLFVSTNVERVHFLQYAILAVFLRMAVLEGYFVVFLATIAGALDELIQFAWHPQYTKYLDFNDMVLNTLGALLGVLIYDTFSLKGSFTEKSRRPIKFFVYAATGMALLGIVWCACTGRIVSYATPDNTFRVLTHVDGRTAFVISFLESSDSWSVTDFGRTYYVLSSLEGLIVLALLLACCRFLLRLFSTERLGLLGVYSCSRNRDL